ncbi:MAG: PfkB family carbohydrate kinase [Candidatus Bathyarchaeota archaeon]|nr:PfkB family carbohydrate kinase [Candidatus Bathyarchaeota archaeon]
MIHCIVELSPQIVGIGRCTLDIIFRLPEFPTWEKGVVYDEYSIDGGGQVGTGLVAASKLGATTGYVGTAGTDYAGELKIESLREWGVDTSNVIRREGPDGQVILVTVQSSTGERVFNHSDRLDSEPLRIDELDYDYITSADYLLVDGSHSVAALEAVKWMREAGKQVVLDGSKTDKPISESTRKLIPYVDVLVCGSGFSEKLTGVSDVYDAGKRVIELGPSIFVETLGERGSVTVTKEGCFETPAFTVEVKDTTGAGDVFHGAYLYGLIKGWNPERITQFSTAVSALKCTRMGGRRSAPSLDEVLEFLKARGVTSF